MKTMEDFNAQAARQIVESGHKDELHNVLVDIKREAEKGKVVLHIYNTISSGTKRELEEKGFKVVSQPSIAIQRDNLYYSIYWD